MTTRPNAAEDVQARALREGQVRPQAVRSKGGRSDVGYCRPSKGCRCKGAYGGDANYKSLSPDEVDVDGSVAPACPLCLSHPDPSLSIPQRRALFGGE